MFARITSTCTRDLAKWGAYTLLLLAPGSFVALPVLWLIKRYAEPGRQAAACDRIVELQPMKVNHTMQASGSLEPLGTAFVRRLVRCLRRWLKSAAADERFLALATDHADLERRMRELDRASLGPVVVTFNH